MNEHRERHQGWRGRPHHDPDDRPSRGRGRPVRGGRGRPGTGRMRRGEVRTALLIALLDGPGHGYELIQYLETKTEGRWRPSPGSVYPSLQMLADEGLATAADVDGKRVYEITDEGRTVAEEHIATKGYPWVAMDEGRGDQRGLMSAMKDMAVAAKMVGMSGSPEDIERASAVLKKARKDLYGILAED